MRFKRAEELQLAAPGLVTHGRLVRSSLKAVRFSAWWMLLLIALLPGRSVVGQDTKLTPGEAVVVQEDVVDSGAGDEPANHGAVVGDSAAPAAEVPESLEEFGDQSLRDRLISYTFFGASLLVFLGILFGYLRLDHATRGFHSGRLQVAALALCAIVFAVSYLIWTQVLFK